MKYIIKIHSRVFYDYDGNIVSKRLWGLYKKDIFYLHRENNLPAVEYSNGRKYYWKNGNEYIFYES